MNLLVAVLVSFLLNTGFVVEQVIGDPPMPPLYLYTFLPHIGK